ncbi:keratin-associated protein [Actinidia rufa]|uniref:Keratin-associated protein n=1 Tax=Actinidia rufa TaxID=165716 RepID=A0A7J0DUM1_9ERIC|nr:keratin-associated protein [Actinidia rufa]
MPLGILGNILGLDGGWIRTRDDPGCKVLKTRPRRDSGGAMAFTAKQMSLIVATFGVLSFIFGVVAENKKPASGTPITGKDVVICKYPSDPTVVLGYLSAAFLIASTVAGYLSLFYPYKGKSIPQSALFRSPSFTVFFNIALGTAGLAAAFLLWPTITEQLHLLRNVHHNLETTCPTAKTGLLGGGAFLSLDASLFWLVSLMLADNAREDYFDEVESGGKGEHGHVQATDYEADGALKHTA